MRIYRKHRTAQNLQAIVNEIVQETKDLPPYCFLNGVQRCAIWTEALQGRKDVIYGSNLTIKISNDAVEIGLYKMLGNTHHEMLTSLEIQQHVKNLACDCDKILQSLKNNFGGCWSVIVTPQNGQIDWAFCSYPPHKQQIVEVKMKNNQSVTITYYTRTELVGISANKLSANRETIPRIIEQICQKYHATGDYDSITNEVLERVSNMEPFVNSINPIRCLICNGYSLYYTTGTSLEMKLENHNLILRQDWGGSARYDKNAASAYLQQLANKSISQMSATEAICDRLEERFNALDWNCAIIYEKDLRRSAIATRPKNLPTIEARGPKGERICAWATKK